MATSTIPTPLAHIASLAPNFKQTLNTPAPQSPLLKQVADTNTLLEAFEEYQNLKSALLTANDYQSITLRGKPKSFIKKAGWRKIATAFSISLDIIRESRMEYDGYFTWDITAKAISPLGRFVTCCAAASSRERDFSKEDHDVRATAQTRACNRAIADLVGFGEVSAEEMSSQAPEKKQTVKTPIKSTAHTVSEQTPTETRPEVKPITPKQRALLIRFAEIRYKDEGSRNIAIKKIDRMNIKEASKAISKVLAKR